MQHAKTCPQYRAASDETIPAAPSLAERIKAERAGTQPKQPVKPGSVLDKSRLRREQQARFAAAMDAKRPLAGE